MARRPRVLGCVRCDKATARLAAISSCTSRPQRKADLRDEAIERFAVSKSAFDFAWIWAIEETGKSSLVRAAAAFAQENNANAADVVPSCSVPLPAATETEESPIRTLLSGKDH